MRKSFLQLLINREPKSLALGRWAGALLVVLCLSLLVPSGGMAATQAHTYYVATTGSDTNAGANAKPWKTIAHAVAEMLPGDTTYVHGGVYDEHVIHFGRSGTKAAPIKLLAAPGELPIINFVDTHRVYSRISVQNYKGQRFAMGWITIEGFEIRDGWNGIWYHNVNDMTIRSNWIHDNLYQGIHGNGTRVLIDRNIISGNGKKSLSSTHYQGIYVNGTGVTITNNLIYGNTAYGIQLNGSHSSYYDPKKEPGPEYALSANWLIANNTIAYNRNRAGIVIWGSTCNNARIINNIFYENGVSLPAGGVQGIGFSGLTATGIKIDNNLFYASGSGATAVIGSGAQEGINYTQSGNIVNVAPDFVNAGPTLPATPNFALRNTSPAIDKGLSVAKVTTDFAGTSRPQGSAFDIGAYEFKVTSPNNPKK